MAFSALPPNARLWIYASNRPLEQAEVDILTRRLDDFLDSWESHGRPVEGTAEIRDRRFVLLAAHRPGASDPDVSGCGIDASVHVLEAFADDSDLQWESGLRVFYRGSDGTVRSASRPEFNKLAEKGRVDAATPVFDLGIESVAALREGRFEHPAGESWHAEAFPLAPAPKKAS